MEEITFDGKNIPKFVLSLFDIDVLYADKLVPVEKGYCGTAIQLFLANIKIKGNIVTVLDTGNEYLLGFAGSKIVNSIKIIQELNIQNNYNELAHIIDRQIESNGRYLDLTDYPFDEYSDKKIELIHESLEFLNSLKIIKEEEFANFYDNSKYIKANDEKLIPYENHVWDLLLPGLIVSHTQSFYIYEGNLVSFITYRDDDNIFKGLIYTLEGK